jgi:hypothetical protein
MTNEEFKDLVLSKVPSGPFKPMVTYDRRDDSIEFLAANDNYRVERIDSLVSVYCSRESGDIIGSLIKGVSGLLKDILQKIPGFQVEIHDGKVKLVHLFQARRWLKAPQNILVLKYKKLEKVAEESDVEAEIGDLAELIGN